ncbi:MAG: rhomboid family intramembrane serine protease, partial [Bacilli bacterium]|nr:rhomboid family intramembrane serine protease [Bacilli bacterium]
NKLKFSEKGLQLFIKITNDINSKNKTEAEKAEEVFRKKKPIITAILVLINMFIFFGSILFGAYDNFIQEYAVYGPFIRSGEYYRLLSGAFLHADIFHLMFNCYALYVIGSQMESFLGKGKYLIVYLFSAIIGSLASITFNQGASVGASGAIFGLLGSMLYFGYHYRVYLGNVLKSQIIPLILLNLGLGFIGTGIDNFAHIGGLIGGTLITVALGIKYKSTTFEKMNGWIVTILFTAFMIYMGIFMPR